MRKNIAYLFIVFSLLFANNVYSQKLTLDELFKLYPMSYEDINEYLGNKNWELGSIKEDTTLLNQKTI